MKDRDGGSLAAYVLGIGIGILLWLTGPALTFGAAWIAGWVLKLFAGKAIAECLNALFGTGRFTPAIVPTATATLSLIAWIFARGGGDDDDDDEDNDG